jgi:glycosyltransferase involved in cell wall biosynthesis
MKVLITITHGNMGGATNFAFWLAKGLKEKNIDVNVGFGDGDYLKNLLIENDIPFYNFKQLKRSANPFKNILFIFEFKKFLNKKKFDIVQLNSTNTLFGAIGAKLSKAKPKVIFTFHGLSVLDSNYKNIFIRAIYWLFFKFSLFFIDQPVFVSQYNLEYAKKIKLLKNGTTIYNGIPQPDFIEKEKVRQFFEQKTNLNMQDNFILGSIGRLDYQKNYEFLIQTFPDILKIKPESILIIIGEGPERKNYEELIKKLNLTEKIFLLGEIKNASQYLKGFDLFILPSRYEGLSITLIEALFAQIPILATDVGGNKEILPEENLYQLNNKTDFLSKFQNVKIPSQPHLEKFQLETMIQNYLDLFNKF